MAAWSPAATPRRVWPSMMRAVRPTTEMSARIPATRPAPTAGPCIADTIGLLHPITLNTRSRASRMARRRNSGSSMIVSIMSKLPPELNPLPAPRSRATRVSGSRSTASHTSASWRCMAGAHRVEAGCIEGDAQHPVGRAVEGQLVEVGVGIGRHRPHHRRRAALLALPALPVLLARPAVVGAGDVGDRFRRGRRRCGAGCGGGGGRRSGGRRCQLTVDLGSGVLEEHGQLGQLVVGDVAGGVGLERRRCPSGRVTPALRRGRRPRPPRGPRRPARRSDRRCRRRTRPAGARPPRPPPIRPITVRAPRCGRGSGRGWPARPGRHRR